MVDSLHFLSYLLDLDGMSQLLMVVSVVSSGSRIFSNCISGIYFSLIGTSKSSVGALVVLVVIVLVDFSGGSRSELFG